MIILTFSYQHKHINDVKYTKFREQCNAFGSFVNLIVEVALDTKCEV